MLILKNHYKYFLFIHLNIMKDNKKSHEYFVMNIVFLYLYRDDNFPKTW